MSRAAWVLGICLMAPLGWAQNFPEKSNPFDPRTSQAIPSHPTDSTRPMWRRAWIQVVPLEILLANKAELDSLRTEVQRAEADAARLEPAEPAARELLYRQTQLLRTFLKFVEQQDSDAGKRPVALEVQRHLNEIEGRAQCDACHTAVVARTGTEPR